MIEDFGWQHLVPLAEGALATLVLCLVAGIAGSILGLILGIAKASPSRIARWISSIYVNLIRGVPLLVIIFFMYFGIPMLFPGAGASAFVTAVVALTVFAAAYIAEIVRGSIQAVAKGQSEAAEALGLNYYLKYRYVIMPQAMKIVVPPGISFLIALVKDSSLITVIGYMELMHAGTVVSNLTAEPIGTFVVVAAMYFVICYGISLLGQLYEKKTGIKVDKLHQPLSV